MWFKQYMVEENKIIYIIWLSESGTYYQSTLTPHLELEHTIKLTN